MVRIAANLASLAALSASLTTGPPAAGLASPTALDAPLPSLEQPRQDAFDSADSALKAQKDLVAAQNELAQAETALAAAKASEAASTGGPTPSVAPASTVTAAPLASSSVVSRVKQADADFTAAQNGVSDTTPLLQAWQQFNAAAVALQISWLQLFADAACLTDEQQKTAEKAVRDDDTVALQQSLTAAGYFKAPVDGVYGPSTVEAVHALQRAHSLPVTGTVDRATDAALQSDLAATGRAAAQQKTASTAAVQPMAGDAHRADWAEQAKLVQAPSYPVLREALRPVRLSVDLDRGIDRSDRVRAGAVPTNAGEGFFHIDRRLPAR